MLGALAGLTSLTFIDFSNQRLYGPLPATAAFPNLRFLNIEHNMIQVGAGCLLFQILSEYPLQAGAVQLHLCDSPTLSVQLGAVSESFSSRVSSSPAPLHCCGVLLCAVPSL